MKSFVILFIALVFALSASPGGAALPKTTPVPDASPVAAQEAGLLAAAAAGDDDTVRDLLKQGAQPTILDDKGDTPLHLAVANGHEKTARLLMEAGADANAVSEEFGETPLFLAASLGLSKTVERLIEHGARVDARDRHLQTPLHMAVYQRHADVVEILLKNGARVNTGGGLHRITPIMVASALGSVDLVKTLLRHGAYVNARDDLGQTALYLASYAGNTEVVKILLDAVADVHPVTETQGQDALMVASAAGFTDIARMLLEHGAVYDRKDKTGTTALMYAGFNRHAEIVNLMLNRQSITMRKNEGEEEPQKPREEGKTGEQREEQNNEQIGEKPPTADGEGESKE
ncbi:MAG: ankyrin repeat domain-containing protein [Proteobacteria bacterium]|nr:ankyrin repeat domain-containing protein [Pseudomonadota bacterium]